MSQYIYAVSIFLLTFFLTACNLEGLAQKGPYAEGSEVKAWMLNSDLERSSGVPLLVYIDGEGRYEISEGLEDETWAELEVSGAFVDESVGEVVSSGLALSIITYLDENDEIANINLYSHLASQRMRSLVQRGVSLQAAWNTAQSELIGMFDIKGGPSLSEGGVAQLNLIDGDGDYRRANGNLFLFSGAFMSAGGDASLLFALAADFSDNGQFDGAGKAFFDKVAKHAGAEGFLSSLAQNMAILGYSDLPNIDDLQILPSWVVVVPNLPPIAESVSYSVVEDGQVTISLFASDPDQDLMQYNLISTTEYGVLAGEAPDLVYSPQANYFGEDHFQFRVSDGELDSDIATISISVAPVNDAPVSYAEVLNVNQADFISIELLGEDIDNDYSELQFEVVQQPSFGVLSGELPILQYVSSADFEGLDSFSYLVSDGQMSSEVSHIQITVVGPDRDGDGVSDLNDIFPDDPTEYLDLDQDGIGDNSDTDRDGDGVNNDLDAFPEDTTETYDSDLDGIGDNSDPDRDGDGVNNEDDYFPSDPEASSVPSVTITEPASLITVGSSPITVKGTVDDPSARLIVNGIEIVHVNGQFVVDVALTEGLNTIVARGIDDKNHEGLSSITVSLDKTPPYVTLQSPEDGQVVYTDSIAVGGLVNDIVRGTVAEDDAVVTVNGLTARVSNRSYLAENVPLSEGVNTISISASDAVGNIESNSIQVVYEVQEVNVIDVVSGQNQSASIHGDAEAPLVVKLTTNDEPVSGKMVVFRVVEGDGLLNIGTEEEARGAIVETDENGEASVPFSLGSRAGVGNHRVRARSVGFEGEALFYASASYGEGNKVGVIAGNNQRGSVRQPLPQPFVVAVTDQGANLIPNAAIEFKVTVGGGVFRNGSDIYSTKTDKDGRASAQFTLGALEGMDQQRVVASLVGTDAVAGFTVSGFVPGEPGLTSISGVVLDNQDNPISGVTITVGGTTRQAVSDGSGQFLITEVPIGPVHLLADGSTSTREGEWPTLSYNIVTVPGIDNSLPSPIYLVEIDTDTAVTLNEEQDQEITLSGIPGFKLKVKAGSVTFPDGSKTGMLSVTPVNSNKIPMPPPNGMQPQFIVTIQPHGALFDPPAELTLPNLDGHLPGAEVEMYSYDHDLEEFVTIGLGTVSNDGSVVTSNNGVGVVKAGWHCGSQAGGSGCCEGGGGEPSCGDCADVSSGGECSGAYSCIPKPPNSPKNNQIEGNCKIELCGGGDVSDDTDTPPEECGECKDGKVTEKDKPLDDQLPDDCKELLCGGEFESVDETAAVKATAGNECKSCDNGEVIDDEQGSCDDGFYCTSADGLEPGPDECSKGECIGKKVISQVEQDATANISLSGMNQKLFDAKLNGCQLSDAKFIDSISMSMIEKKECCESQQDMIAAQELKGTVNLVERSFSCGYFRPVYGPIILGAQLIISGSASLNGSGVKTSCEESCSWSIGTSVSVNAKGEVVLAVGHPDFLSVAGGLSGGGNFNGAIDCNENIALGGCFGPASMVATIKAVGGFEVVYSKVIEDTISCL